MTGASIGQDVLRQVIDFVFPPRCGGCGARGTWFCDSCHATVSRPVALACGRCGRVTSVQPCPLCAWGPQAPDSIRALGRFEGPLRAAIHRLKYGDRPRLAIHLVAALWDPNLAPAAPLCAVPAHPATLRRRGYNQAQAIAAAAARSSGVGLVVGLGREGDVASQVGRGGADRREAAVGAFRWAGRVPAPGMVVVVDDVVTTGATLVHCAAALRRGGSREVHALALAQST